MQRHLAVCILATVLTVIAGDARSAPCAGFTDVDSTHPFCTEVAWIKNRGITLGCTTTLYCPSDTVNRLQMAVFLYRLGNASAQFGGNATNDTARLGTTTFQPVEIIAAGGRAMRFEPHGFSPNIVGGHPQNAVSPGSYGATVAGGGAGATIVSGITCDQPQVCVNVVTDTGGTVSGGVANQAGNGDGDTFNTVAATVGGGFGNTAAAGQSTVSGGLYNDATGRFAAIAGGASNMAAGQSSFVAGGVGNRAMGTQSFAAGGYSYANHDGCFVFGGTLGGVTSCFAPNEVVIRGLGGFYFWTGGTNDNTYSGARLATGTGAWAAYSDVDGKEAFAEVDAEDILRRLSRMKVGTWQWKHEPGAVRHIGPTAQDFQAAFSVGSSDRHIVTIDADGVALAAIKGVNVKLEAGLAAKEAETAALRAEVTALRESVVAMQAQLKDLVRDTPRLAR